MTKIELRGPVGEGGFTAAALLEQLRAAGNRPVTVSIDSPGGDVTEGLRCVEALRGHRAGQVTTVVESGSMAESMAALVFCAGRRRVVGEHAKITPHAVHGVLRSGVHASAGELLLAAFSPSLPREARWFAARACDQLRMSTARLAAVYSQLVGGSPAQWQERMATGRPYVGPVACRWHGLTTPEESAT